jgi:hypothetical protein
LAGGVLLRGEAALEAGDISWVRQLARLRCGNVGANRKFALFATLKPGEITHQAKGWT